MNASETDRKTFVLGRCISKFAKAMATHAIKVRKAGSIEPVSRPLADHAIAVATNGNIHSKSRKEIRFLMIIRLLLILPENGGGVGRKRRAERSAD